MLNEPSLDSIIEDWRKEHEAHAGDYGDRPWGIQWGGEGHTEWLRELIAPHIEGKRVYEIGCGGGKYTKVLFECGAKSVVATDVHEVAIAAACEYEPRATYLQTDGESIPYGADAFDLVFTYDVLLHLPPELVVKYLQEGRRVANEMLIQLPILDLPAARAWFLRRVAERAYLAPYSLGYFNFYTDDMIDRLISLAGWGRNCLYLGHNERDSVWLCRK